jgi:hypothetical protein
VALLPSKLLVGHPIHEAVFVGLVADPLAAIERIDLLNIVLFKRR